MSLSARILPKSLFETVKRTHRIAAFGRRARLALGSRLGARHVAGLGGRAHYNDLLLVSTVAAQVERYRHGAAEFVDILDGALREAGRDWTDIGFCLDVGCGYGRVVRDLRRKLPARAISVCDLNEEAAQFTASEFGVRKLPIVEMMGPARNGAFDLVYLLSVYTQLDRPMIEMNLAKVAALMRPGGVVVFTTRSGRGSHGNQSDTAAFEAEMRRFGFVHRRGPGEEGTTWIAADEVMRLVAQMAPGLAFVTHKLGAIDGSQDVFVYRRV